MIKIKHNLDATKFKWLWSKYVEGGNDEKHCTNSLKGKYSKKFSKHNENFNNETTIIFDEQPEDKFKAIYICSVINKGYSQKKNYPHNVHLAMVPKEGARCLYQFEEWEIEIEELPVKYQGLPEEYVNYRIFRWAIGYFFNTNEEN